MVPTPEAGLAETSKASLEPAEEGLSSSLSPEMKPESKDKDKKEQDSPQEKKSNQDDLDVPEPENTPDAPPNLNKYAGQSAELKELHGGLGKAKEMIRGIFSGATNSNLINDVKGKKLDLEEEEEEKKQDKKKDDKDKKEEDNSENPTDQLSSSPEMSPKPEGGLTKKAKDNDLASKAEAGPNAGGLGAGSGAGATAGGAEAGAVTGEPITTAMLMVASTIKEEQEKQQEEQENRQNDDQASLQSAPTCTPHG